jgi:hypothetical protein
MHTKRLYGERTRRRIESAYIQSVWHAKIEREDGSLSKQIRDVNPLLFMRKRNASLLAKGGKNTSQKNLHM